MTTAFSDEHSHPYLECPHDGSVACISFKKQKTFLFLLLYHLSGLISSCCASEKVLYVGYFYTLLSDKYFQAQS